MTRKQRRLVLIGGGLGVLALAVGLMLNALRDSIVFFNSPSDIAEKHIGPGTRIRLGGLVKDGSIVRGNDLRVRFEVTDGKSELPVSYQGILPDLFREGQGVIAEGTLDRRRLQSRYRAGQARRDLYAEGSRRRLEEAGALRKIRRRERKMIAGGSAITRWCWRWPWP